MTPSERQQWLEERRQGIGGSDVAPILGFSPWSTPLNVWMEKTGRALPKPENEAMRIGTELEDFVARRYTQETGKQVQRFNKMLHCGCLLGNFDRLIVPDGARAASYKGEIRTNAILECKTASVDWNGEVPVYYLTQVQHYLGLDPKLERADIACLFLTHKHFETYTVYRDDAVIAEMQERLTEWWKEYVLGDKMPMAVNEEDNKLAWALANPGKKVIATEEVKRKLEEYKAAQAEAKETKARVEDLKTQLCAFMQDAEVLTDERGNALATWRNNRESAKTDWEALALSLNATKEQINKYTITTQGARPFKLKAVKTSSAQAA